MTIAHIADEIGLKRETLRNWIRKDDDARSASVTTPDRSRADTSAPAKENLEQENERLRAQVAELT
ncbi:transposase-like protein [Nocardiopsis arvandica]|uniref:Transposase-like protein n=1 Tax=Nocardiopsis sinuspersici TaxID=501010 RepID=A0A7Y9X8Z2_9ACTN|nr:transposase-like protein [Nocardiopsis sinuspersici]